MAHSAVTGRGRTTIPAEIRAALRLKPGDQLVYVLAGNQATIRVHPGTRSLKGALASDEGKSTSFANIREAASSARLRREAAR